MPMHEPSLGSFPARIKAATGIGYPLAEVRKAIAGGLAGAVPLFAVDIADFHISRGESGGLLGAFALGALAVFHIRNADAAPPAGDE